MLVPIADVQSVDELRRLYRRTRSAMRDPANAIGPHKAHGSRQGAVKVIPALPDPEAPLRASAARCARPDWGFLAMLAMLCQVEGPPDSEEDDPQPAQLPQPGIITLAELRREVCRWHGLTISEFRMRDRSTFLAQARAEFYFLAYKLTKRSFPDMVRFTGAMNHTSAIHGVKVHKARLGVRTDDSVELKWV